MTRYIITHSVRAVLVSEVCTEPPSGCVTGLVPVTCAQLKWVSSCRTPEHRVELALQGEAPIYRFKCMLLLRRK